MKRTIQILAKEYDTKMKVEDLVVEIYTRIRDRDIDISILNDKYLLVDDVAYAFRRKNNQWTVQTF